MLWYFLESSMEWMQATSFKLTHWNQQKDDRYSPVKIQNFLRHRHHTDKTQNRATGKLVVGICFCWSGILTILRSVAHIIVYRGPFAVIIEKFQPRLTKHNLWRRMADKIRWRQTAAPSTRTIKYVKFYFFTKQTLLKKIKILIHRPEILINTL